MTTYQFFREYEKKSVFAFSGVLLALLTLTRSDGVFFIFGFLSVRLLSSFFSSGRLNKKDVYWMLSLVGIFSVIYVPYFLWRWDYYGYFFPNTYYSKGVGGAFLISKGIRHLINFIFESGGLLLLISLIPFYKRANLYYYILATVIGIRIIFHVHTGGPWVGHHRFLMPILPFLFFLLVEGLWILKEKFVRRSIYIFLIFLTLVSTFSLTTVVFHENYNSDRAMAFKNAHISLGMWLDKNSPPDAVIACPDAGAIPFYSKRTNIDTLGINDEHIAHLKGKHYKKYDVAYVLNRSPDYVILLGGTDSDNAFKALIRGDEALYRSKRFQEEYEFLRTYRYTDTYFLWLYHKVS